MGIIYNREHKVIKTIIEEQVKCYRNILNTYLRDVIRSINHIYKRYIFINFIHFKA